jgi:hypothetical protein
MKIEVTTAFDCTPTLVTGNFSKDRLPMSTKQGLMVQNHIEWAHARNQQRNWETMLQLMQLRSHIVAYSEPQRDAHTNLWKFEFEIERPEVYQNGTDPLGCLLDDCANVPIVIKLTESDGCANTIYVKGPEQNVWFQILDK